MKTLKTLTVLALFIVVFMNDQPIKKVGSFSADILYKKNIQMHTMDPGH
ncbi:hypothetical protein QO009_001644 [Brevibacillus aydinogluensis]|jgi:hypothetical protein|uniref:Uncharacterized protein n=1 Tax=Brevibacillus aydinogluensis TaxID=927786 RepID=A0AA48RCV6_9BACL|nr:hypothetical protein [Brevibacillus aydinogluensis]CAJ1001343.1 hypothetical protein BSPP4475_03280 [Brevibacillus aydinogluensis]